MGTGQTPEYERHSKDSLSLPVQQGRICTMRLNLSILILALQCAPLPVLSAEVSGRTTTRQSAPGPEQPAEDGVCMAYQNVCQKDGHISIGTRASDDDLVALESTKGVTSIFFIIGPNSVGTAKVSDAGLVHLSHLDTLERAYLMELPEITNAGLASLSHLTRLRELHMEGNRNINDAGLAHLSGLNELRELTFFGAPITDRGLLHLRNAVHLQNLHLGRSLITDAGLKNIAGFRELTTLDLQGTRVTDAGIDALSRLSKLNWLCLGSAITDYGLRRLTSLKSLRDLYLPGTATSPAARTALTKAIPGLQIHLME